MTCFIPHDIKSITTQTQTIEHLGFVQNSIEMALSISPDKNQKLCHAISHVLEQDMPSIRAVAQIIGMMVTPFPGVEYGQLFYCQLEVDKIAALKRHKVEFDMPMPVVRADTNWWITRACFRRRSSHAPNLIVLSSTLERH